MTEVMDAGSPSLPAGRPKPTAVGPVAWGRIVLGTVGVVAVAGLAMAAVGVLDGGGAQPLLVVALGLAVIPLIASPIEWFVHRFVYHEPVIRPLGTIYNVHTAHHYAFFPTWRYVTSGPARRLSIRRRTPDVHTTPLRNAGVRVSHFAWYLAIGAVVVWLPAWLVTRSVPFLVGLMISSAVVSNLFIVVHDTIHRPGSHRLVEAQPWYPFLDRHHYIHHIDLGANLNFLLPLADLLFGTLRTSLRPEEEAAHGSLADAKTRPLGEGERARLAVG